MTLDQLMRVVAGGLKQALHDHGPITKHNYGSAAKRITKQLWHHEKLGLDSIDATGERPSKAGGEGQENRTFEKSVTEEVE